MTPTSAARILRKVSRENAFYFFTSIGNYTGHKATSLEEFVDKVWEVNVKSLEFHLYRGDFEKWAEEVLEDQEFSRQITDFKKRKTTGDPLRNQLYLISSKRFDKLKSEFLG